MLEINHSSEAKSISTRSALWESNSATPIKANVDKFKKSLTNDEIEIIESITGKYMDYYGYEHITKGAADVETKATLEAEKRSEINRQKAWNALKMNDPRDYMLRKYRNDYLDMVKSRLLREKDIFRETA